MFELLGRLFVGLLCVVCVLMTSTAAAEDGWVSLFDGKSLAGWKASEGSELIRAHNGTILCDGPGASLYYAGDVEGTVFQNFELKVAVMTAPGACAGILFHTKYRASGVPGQGYEVRIDNSPPGRGSTRI